MIQRDRLLRALDRGPVAATAFSLPDVIDDGPPIFRVAARVGELRDAGYAITTSRASNGVAVYQLVRNASSVDERVAPSLGGPTDPADNTSASPAPPGLAGTELSTQPMAPSEKDRPAPARVDTPTSTDSPSGAGGQSFRDSLVSTSRGTGRQHADPLSKGAGGQLFPATIVEYTSRPHWMDV